MYGEYTLYRSLYMCYIRYGSEAAPALAKADACYGFALFQLARPLLVLVQGLEMRVWGLCFGVWG
jgi:hypothetical protein